MRLTFMTVKKYEMKVLKSEPSHDIILSDTYMNRLLDIYEFERKQFGLLPGQIPSKFIHDGEIPIPDLFIRLSEYNARARITLFDNPRRNFCPFINNKELIVGSIIYDCGVAKPEMFFAVSPNYDDIRVINDKWVFGAATSSDRHKIIRHFGLERYGDVAMAEHILRLWYAIQETARYGKSIYKQEYDQIKTQIVISISEKDLFPKKMVCATDIEKAYQRHKIKWFQPGHEKNVEARNPETKEIETRRIFVNGGWRFAQTINEDSEDTKRRITNRLERKKKKENSKKKKEVNNDDRV